MDDTERAELGAALDRAQSFDDLAVISSRMMTIGGRELGKIANGLEPIDRVEAARLRAAAACLRAPEQEQDTQDETP